jgi:hypothetical protein
MMTCIQGSLWTLALQLLEEMRQPWEDGWEMNFVGILMSKR